jgi:ATP-dependent DNA helicase 2 subunit 2
VINAFQYGINIVPFDKPVEEASKIHEEKNFTLLGFVNSSEIPRHCFLGEVDIVVPQQEPSGKGESHDILFSRKLFSAIIYSTISQRKYALARYVPRNSKSGVNPRMVVLIPYRSSEREMFYLIELPTIEGVREYPFNSLKQSTKEQKGLVSELVDKMMLTNAETGHEEVKIDSLFNPRIQYFYQTIFHKVWWNDQNEHK